MGMLHSWCSILLVHRWKVEDVTYQRSIGATDKVRCGKLRLLVMPVTLLLQDIRSKAHWKKHRKLARQKRKSVIAKKVKEAKAKEESGEQIVEDGLVRLLLWLQRSFQERDCGVSGCVRECLMYDRVCVRFESCVKLHKLS